MLNFYLRRGSKSPYSHLECFPGGDPPNPNERRRPLHMFCPSNNSRLWHSRTPMCTVHARLWRAYNLLFLGYAPVLCFLFGHFSCTQGLIGSFIGSFSKLDIKSCCCLSNKFGHLNYEMLNKTCSRKKINQY